ncbi:MAG: hypothetical protein WAM69_00970 [Candidatus Sulfotelmatobacter sp.]
MPPHLESLWDDENFSVQSGVIPGQARFSGADLGPGIIYYPVHVNLTHRLAGTIQPIPSPHPSSGQRNFLWNTGTDTEIFNPHESSSRFVRVALKPSPQLAAELPQDFLGLASAALLQDDWAQPFKDSVRDDLDVIHAFIEPLNSGQTPGPESLERAILAKQDLDLKLLWSAREYGHRGLFTPGYRTTTLAAATPATGMINVIVYTKDRANTDVSGCVVWYVTRINHSKPGSYKSFSRFSTPTSEYLYVSNYEMWAEKGGINGTKRVVSIVSATATQSVDLLAP